MAAAQNMIAVRGHHYYHFGPEPQLSTFHVQSFGPIRNRLPDTQVAGVLMFGPNSTFYRSNVSIGKTRFLIVGYYDPDEQDRNETLAYLDPSIDWRGEIVALSLGIRTTFRTKPFKLSWEKAAVTVFMHHVTQCRALGIQYKQSLPILPSSAIYKALTAIPIRRRRRRNVSPVPAPSPAPSAVPQDDGYDSDMGGGFPDQNNDDRNNNMGYGGLPDQRDEEDCNSSAGNDGFSDQHDEDEQSDSSEATGVAILNARVGSTSAQVSDDDDAESDIVDDQLQYPGYYDILPKFPILDDYAAYHTLNAFTQYERHADDDILV